MEHPKQIGKYELEHFLGGGMSHVYRARDRVLGRRVAVKVLSPTASINPESKAKFLQEARLASNIRHENIVSIYDFGEEDGRPFMVMEFLDGESLRDAIANGHASSLDRQLGIALQIGRALDYVHSRKIVHRDIKPENVVLDRTGQVKLMDFGIASLGDGGGMGGVTSGTPYYMAPEQVLGQPLTPQADVYSFGVLFYELLTGTKPVTGKTVDDVFKTILYQPLAAGPLEENQVPPVLRLLIARMTAKKLIERPRNMGEVCDAIEKLIAPGSRKPAKHEPAPAGLLSPSSTRAQVEEVRLKMPPPPPPQSDMPQALSILPAGLRSQWGLAVLSAVAVAVMVLLLFGLLVGR